MRRTAGISLMLLIFLSLCLITFSLLSLSGATADEKLAQKSAERTAEYYNAVTSANEVLDEIDSQLAAALREALGNSQSYEAGSSADDSKADYADACGTITVSDAALSWTAGSGEASAADTDTENAPAVIGTFEYDVSVTDDQLLHVELSVVWPESDTDSLYRVTCWQVVSTADWSADTSQSLYRTGTED